MKELTEYAVDCDLSTACNLCDRYLPLTIGNRWSYSGHGTDIDEYLDRVIYGNSFEVDGIRPGSEGEMIFLSHSGYILEK